MNYIWQITVLSTKLQMFFVIYFIHFCYSKHSNMLREAYFPVVDVHLLFPTHQQNSTPPPLGKDWGKTRIYRLRSDLWLDLWKYRGGCKTISNHEPSSTVPDTWYEVFILMSCAWLLFHMALCIRDTNLGVVSSIKILCFRSLVACSAVTLKYLEMLPINM